MNYNPLTLARLQAFLFIVLSALLVGLLVNLGAQFNNVLTFTFAMCISISTLMLLDRGHRMVDQMHLMEMEAIWRKRFVRKFRNYESWPELRRYLVAREREGRW